MRCRVEEAAACLGKLLMRAGFNPRFPIPDIIGSEGEEQPTGIDLKSAGSAAHSRKPNEKRGNPSKKVVERGLICTIGDA